MLRLLRCNADEVRFRVQHGMDTPILFFSTHGAHLHTFSSSVLFSWLSSRSYICSRFLPPLDPTAQIGIYPRNVWLW